MDHTPLLIGGDRRAGGLGARPILNPATGEELGTVALASAADLDDALACAADGFRLWRDKSALERCAILRETAAILRRDCARIARLLTEEQGKPLDQSVTEVSISAEVLEWSAEEGRRLYGTVVPPRSPAFRQTITLEPVGPVLALTPWNFPLLTSARKLGEALAAGCPVVLKAAEETPRAVLQLVLAFYEAGLPRPALSLVFGDPAMVSSHCIASAVIRKISFTGSTRIGRQLMALAAPGLKRATMELGGHAPVVVFDDVDPGHVARMAVAAKFRNAGQVCNSPTRFYVHEASYDAFRQSFVAAAAALRIGNGLDDATQMGPLAHARRVSAMEELVADAEARGARVACGGRRPGNVGDFFPPTVLTDLDPGARIMTEEPFGPVVPIMPFSSTDEALAAANATPYGLAAFVFTNRQETEHDFTRGLAAGAIAVNHFTVVGVEVPFGGIGDSGFGSEGGREGIRNYVTPKYVTVSPKTM